MTKQSVSPSSLYRFGETKINLGTDGKFTPTEHPRQSLILETQLEYTEAIPLSKHVIGFLGFIYVAGSLFTSYNFLVVLEPILKNDMWWPYFHETGVHAFLGDLFNFYLESIDKMDLDLFSTSSTMVKEYKSSEFFESENSIDLSPAYSRMLAMASTTNLEDIINGLHTKRVEFLIPMQFCWADFDRRFELAATERRQIRCSRQYYDNGASYLESILRNLIPSTWESYFGGYGSFSTTISDPIQQLPGGYEWLHSLRQQFNTEEEANYWRSKGITRWQLHWHNCWQVSIHETIIAQNAVGMQQVLPIKKLMYMDMATPWTSSVLNGGGIFLSMVNAMEGNYSLVRNINQSLNQSLPEAELASLAGAQETLASWLWNNNIGPYGAIDMFWVPIPTELQSMLMKQRLAILKHIHENYSFFSEGSEVLPIYSAITPKAWRNPNFIYFGGSPFCENNQGTLYAQSMFGFDGSCLSQQDMFAPLTPSAAIFAASMYNIPDLLRLMCNNKHESAPLCEGAVSFAIQTVDRLNLAAPANEIQELTTKLSGITIMQFAYDDNSNDEIFLEQSLVGSVDNDPLWTFFGWAMMHDWVILNREVVRFEGDKRNITLMSKFYEIVSFYPNKYEISQQTGVYVYFMVLYIFSVLCFVGVLAFTWSSLSCFNHLASMLFRFNRVVGSVWVGRNLLLVRGFTAIVVLSSSLPYLVSMNGLSQLIVMKRSIVHSVVIVGESLWVVYVLQEILAAFVQGYSWHAAPISTLLAFFVLFSYDFFLPVIPSAQIERVCTTIEVGIHIVCNSGIVHIGSFSRILIILAIQISSTMVVYLGVILLGYKRESTQASLLMSVSAEAFLSPISNEGNDSTSFHKVSCVLAGILSFEFGNTLYIFDIKSWTIIQESRQHERNSIKLGQIPQLGSNLIPVGPQEFRALDKIIAFAGFVYMIGSIVGSFFFIESIKINFSNDMWWTNFNSTGTMGYLMNWYTRQLVLNPTRFIGQIDDIKFADPNEYNSNQTVIRYSSLYSRLAQQQEQQKSLLQVIEGLRAMESCHLPWISTQYCWLDFKKQFEMANTQKRQGRCQRYRANGAVYLEALLRNANWWEGRDCWASAFNIGFGEYLKSTPDWEYWLNKIQYNTHYLSPQAEVNHWQQHFIEHFTTQFQNYKQIGLQEQFRVKNALGVSFPITLKMTRGRYHLETQTSLKLYWTLGGDFQSINSSYSIMYNMSLLRASPKFAYTNSSIRDYIMSSFVMAQPLSHDIEKTIGPFGSIDAIIVPCPPSLQEFYYKTSNAVSALAATLEDVPNIAYELASSWQWIVCPSDWIGIERFGGSPLCSKSEISTSIAMFGLWSSVNCAATTESILATGMSTIVSVAAGDDVSQSCGNQINYSWDCHKRLQDALEFTSHFNSLDFNMIQELALRAKNEIMELNVSLMQIDEGGHFLVRSLFDPIAPEFYVFAWEFAIEWLFGRREVVSFEGDEGTLVLLSSARMPIDILPNPVEIPVNVAWYMRTIMIYITTVLGCVASLVSAYIVMSAGRVEGWNAFEINRVGGLAWIGRPLLFLRSIVAICLLSTAQLELQQHGSLGLMTVLVSRRYEWYKVIMASGEVAWLGYVVSDILILLTRGHTMTTAISSTMLLSAAVAIWSFQRPVVHRVVVDRVCRMPQVDFQLECDAGTIYIGSTTRVLEFILMPILCTGVCYLVNRWLRPNRVDTRANASLLLSPSAKYMFEMEAWTFENVYFLDRASAVLTGLLYVESGKRSYIFDVKLWRLFVIDQGIVQIPKDHPMYSRIQYSIPLVSNAHKMSRL